MQEELQSKLVEILTSIQAATGKAADFAMDQLPDIAQSYVVYGRVSATFWAALAFASLAAIFCKRKALDDALNNGDFWPVPTIFGAAVAGLIFITSLQSAFLAWLAPKVWLLKELAQLVK